MKITLRFVQRNDTILPSGRLKNSYYFPFRLNLAF